MRKDYKDLQSTLRIEQTEDLYMRVHMLSNTLKRGPDILQSLHFQNLHPPSEVPAKDMKMIMYIWLLYSAVISNPYPAFLNLMPA